MRGYSGCEAAGLIQAAIDGGYSPDAPELEETEEALMLAAEEDEELAST